MGETEDLRKEMMEAAMSVAIDRAVDLGKGWWHKRCRKTLQDAEQNHRQEMMNLSFAFLCFAEAMSLSSDKHGVRFTDASEPKVMLNPILSLRLTEVYDQIQRCCPDVYKRWCERMGQAYGPPCHDEKPEGRE